MGFERNYQVKIPSKQIIKRQFYSTEPSTNQLTQLIEPWFLTGFTDAEGCLLKFVNLKKIN